jgi:hypothetical protein
MTEEWRKIPGLPDRYEVSNFGGLRSWVGAGGKRHERPRKKQIYRAGPSRGIAMFYVGKTTAGKKIHKALSVGRCVLLAFVGPPPDNKPFCLHRDDNRLNNRIGNLRWGTQLENILDAQINGLVPISYKPKIHGSKLHPKMIPALFRLADMDVSISLLAYLFDVDIAIISKTLNGKLHINHEEHASQIEAEDRRIETKRQFFEARQQQS